MSLDADYLKASVGTVLAQGIAETVAEQPDDPVGFLAQFLLKSVSDEKAEKELTVAKAADAKVTAEKAAAAKAAAEKAADTEAAKTMQVEKEDKRLANLLESATSSDEVFTAVLTYVRARTGASGYVMLTDLPEKIIPKKVEPAPAAEEPPAPAEGEEGY